MMRIGARRNAPKTVAPQFSLYFRVSVLICIKRTYRSVQCFINLETASFLERRIRFRSATRFPFQAVILSPIARPGVENVDYSLQFVGQLRDVAQ